MTSETSEIQQALAQLGIKSKYLTFGLTLLSTFLWIVWVFDGLAGAIERYFSVFLPEALILAIALEVTCATIVLGPLVSLLRKKPHLFKYRIKRLRAMLLSLVCVLIVTSIILDVHFWRGGYRLVGTNSMIVYVDDFELHGLEDIAFEQRMLQALNRELGNVYPELQVRSLPDPPNPHWSRQQRHDWACQNGAIMTISGTADVAGILPDIRLCSVPNETGNTLVSPLRLSILGQSLEVPFEWDSLSNIGFCRQADLSFSEIRYVSLIAISLYFLSNSDTTLSPDTRLSAAVESLNRARRIVRDEKLCKLDSYYALKLEAIVNLYLATQFQEGPARFGFLSIALEDIDNCCSIRGLPNDYVMRGILQFCRATSETVPQQRLSIEQSRASADTALMLDAKNRGGFLVKGLACLIASNLADSLDPVEHLKTSTFSLKQAIALDPNNRHIYHIYGMSLMLLGLKVSDSTSIDLLNQAEYYLKAAAFLDKSNANAPLLLGVLLFRRAMTEVPNPDLVALREGVAAIVMSLQRDPSSRQALSNLAIAIRHCYSDSSVQKLSSELLDLVNGDTGLRECYLKLADLGHQIQTTECPIDFLEPFARSAAEFVPHRQ